jgi:hypothetical protein
LYRHGFLAERTMHERHPLVHEHPELFDHRRKHAQATGTTPDVGVSRLGRTDDADICAPHCIDASIADAKERRGLGTPLSIDQGSSSRSPTYGPGETFRLSGRRHADQVHDEIGDPRHTPFAHMCREDRRRRITPESCQKSSKAQRIVESCRGRDSNPHGVAPTGF